MNILIPMAGAGARFFEKGYLTHKPLLPLTSRHNLETVPLVVAAVRDLPVDLEREDVNLLFIVRDFHIADDVDRKILAYLPNAQFIVIDALTDGQARTCLYAREQFDTDEALMIAACDNGMDVSCELFMTQTHQADALIFTFRGNEAVTEKPESYGWVQTENERVTSVSIKRPLSTRPMEDHAVVGAFWFKRGRDFFSAADQMIENDDRINGEFYVDQVFQYLLSGKCNVSVVEIERYLCWGTPEDYEIYEATLRYWSEFVAKEAWVK